MDKQQSLIETNVMEIKTEAAEDSSTLIEGIKNEEFMVDHADIKVLEEFKSEDIGESPKREFDMLENFVTLNYEIKSEEMNISYASLKKDVDLKGSNLHDPVTVIESSSATWCDRSSKDNVKVELQSSCSPNGKVSKKQWQNIEVNQLTAGDSDKTQQGKDISFNCFHCDYSTISRRNLVRHLLVHDKRKKLFPCTSCDYSTKHKQDLVQHMIKLHSGNYKKHSCTWCEKHFKERRSLDNHIIRNHENFIDLVSSKVHSCPTCDYKTTIKSNISGHMVHVHFGNYEKHSCVYCEKRFKRKILLDDHILKNHQNLTDSVMSKVHNCPTCNYKTTIKSNLTHHMSDLHSINYKTYSCTCCEVQCKNNKLLDDHILKNHPKLIDSVGSRVYNCPTCSYKTTIKDDLRQHMIKIHSDNSKNYPCTYCEKHFRTKVFLHEHIIQNHRNFVDSVSSKVHICPTCDYKTTKKGNLKRHTINVHDYKTVIKGRLKRHTIDIHLGDSGQHSCTYCEKHFQKQISLDKHMKTNHQKFIDSLNSKVHKCPTCNYRTTRRDNLKRHMNKIHL